MKGKNSQVEVTKKHRKKKKDPLTKKTFKKGENAFSLLKENQNGEETDRRGYGAVTGQRKRKGKVVKESQDSAGRRVVVFVGGEKGREVELMRVGPLSRPRKARERMRKWA